MTNKISGEQMSKPIALPLVAMTTNNTIAKPQEANDVYCFVSKDRNVIIYFPSSDDESHIILKTLNGYYKLNKHPTMNIYTGACKGHSVHVSLKKIVGELRYW